jgi:hypothetical protein
MVEADPPVEVLSRSIFYQKQHFKLQIKSGEKTTTYREWLPATLARFEGRLAKGELVCMGSQNDRWGVCKFISIGKDFRLHSMTPEDVRKDGGGDMSPQSFLKKFFKEVYDDKEAKAIRVEFKYVRDFPTTECDRVILARVNLRRRIKALKEKNRIKNKVDLALQYQFHYYYY